MLAPKKVSMTNKVIRQKSRCSSFVARKSRFLKQQHNNINPKLFMY